MSSSPETSTRMTGAHRAHRGAREARDRTAARALAQRPPARYEPYLDGLFTYCLSVLCDHDAATSALGDALAVAEANEELQKGKSGVVFTIPEAEIELSVALTINEQKDVKAGLSGNIYAFAVNASYASTFGYKAEASSKIRIKLQASNGKPADAAPPAPAPAPQAG